MNWDVEHGHGWASHRESNLNRLKSIERFKLTVSPAAADVWFKVVVQRITPTTEVRGQIVGPRCLFAESGDGESPLRSVRQHEDESAALLIARTAIPNPAFWTPDSPLLYRVVVELWQDGQRCEASGFDLGFRRVEMGWDGVLANQVPVLLRGTQEMPESWQGAAAWRRAGYNLIVAGKGQWNWWVRANPMGFFLLERVALSTLTPQYVGLVSQQPCFLGFVLDRELLDRSPAENERFLRPWRERHVFIGLELDGPPPPQLPDGLSFLICPEWVLPSLSSISLPAFVSREGTAARQPLPGPVPGVLGWIDQ